ncbi:MAG: DNA repair protein RecO [Gammaproteobacteria bacterium]|nr:DNA repair protein RecO [Gammaproteobacteria bacterium]
MRVLLQPAYILHHRPYRETSVLMDLFAEKQGRITVIARGVRTPQSKLRSILQPFTPLTVSWQGKTELMTLVSAEAQGLPLTLRGDCLLSAFYLNELLMRLLPKNDPYPLLYTIYQKTLIDLQSDTLKQHILRLFEKQLLTELGYGIELKYDFTTGKAIIAEQFYRYVPEHGFTVCNKGFKEKSNYIFCGKHLLAFANDQLENEECLQEAKRLMRILLSFVMGTQTINSRKLFI